MSLDTIHSLEQQLEDARHNEQPERLNHLYIQLGTQYMAQKSYEAGVAMFNQAIEIAQDLQNRALEAYTIGAQGLALYEPLLRQFNLN